jgi:hypothetical protein
LTVTRRMVYSIGILTTKKKLYSLRLTAKFKPG